VPVHRKELRRVFEAQVAALRRERVAPYLVCWRRGERLAGHLQSSQDMLDRAIAGGAEAFLCDARFGERLKPLPQLAAHLAAGRCNDRLVRGLAVYPASDSTIRATCSKQRTKRRALLAGSVLNGARGAHETSASSTSFCAWACQAIASLSEARLVQLRAVVSEQPSASAMSR